MTKDQLIAFEARVAEAFNAGKIRGPVHLSSGNELDLMEIFLDVRPQDWVFTNWRSHYHCLLKGVPEDVLMRDILAGKSITLNYPEHKIMSSAIVGGAVPIAVGVAMAIKRSGADERVHCFFGDMAEHSGIVHECRRYAEGHGLPIRFYCEDNGKSVCTPTAEVWGINKDPLHIIARTRFYKYDLTWPHSGAGVRVEF